jgi:hydrogenase maturation protease
VTDASPAPVLVIGVGNELRGDDGVGIVAVRRLADPAPRLRVDLGEEQNDPSALLPRWRGRQAVVLIDAVAESPGTIQRFDASRRALPRELRLSTSTHAVGLDEAIELGRALGNLPARVVVYAVGGRCFEAGAGLSTEVAATLPELTERVLAEVVALGGGGSAAP